MGIKPITLVSKSIRTFDLVNDLLDFVNFVVMSFPTNTPMVHFG